MLENAGELDYEPIQHRPPLDRHLDASLESPAGKQPAALRQDDVAGHAASQSMGPTCCPQAAPARSVIAAVPRAFSPTFLIYVLIGSADHNAGHDSITSIPAVILAEWSSPNAVNPASSSEGQSRERRMDSIRSDSWRRHASLLRDGRASRVSGRGIRFPATSVLLEAGEQGSRRFAACDPVLPRSCRSRERPKSLPSELSVPVDKATSAVDEAAASG